MRCNELQTKIAVADVLTPDEIRHIETCSDCRVYAAFDTELDDRLVRWRASPEMPRRRAPARGFRMAYAGAALAAALIFAVLILPTRSNAQSAYRRMIDGTRRVVSVHLVVRWRGGEGRVEDGPMRKKYELWWRPGAWREQWEGLRPSLKRGEEGSLTFYRYDPKKGQVERYREEAKQPDFGTFDLASFAGQYMDAPKRFEQPSPTRIVTTNGGDWSRMVFTIDPATGLPSHAEKQSRDARGAWQTSGAIDLEFDHSIPEARFEPESLMERVKP